MAPPDLAKCEELDDTYFKAEVLAATILAEVKTEFSYARTVSEKSCHFSHLSDSIIFVKAKDLVASVLGKATEDIAKAAMEMSYEHTVSEVWSLTFNHAATIFFQARDLVARVLEKVTEEFEEQEVGNGRNL